MEIFDLNASIQEKVLVITALKYELRKLKGKALVDNAVTKHTIDPEILKIDVEPITLKLLNNRTADSAYIKHTQEEAAVLRDLVEHVNANYPLDQPLEFSYRYTKQIQDLLSNISKTCPSINNSGKKLVAVTIKNKDKRVRFLEPVTSSGNTKTTSSSNLVSNKPTLSSTGVRPSTSASGLQPTSNTKKDKIQRTPSNTTKNKVEVHPKRTLWPTTTDNGTEFVNQTLREYYEKVGISHETFVARSPQQNGVVERRNRTLIEASRTMLIYAKAPLFLWPEAVATACYTQNRFIVRIRHGKMPYELLHDKPPDLLFFHVFGELCYLTNDSENLGKLQPKADIGIFIGYAPTKKAFRIFNRRTRRIIETIHVDFDELTAMASEHSSSGPALH
ncbi:retrovirus-related pol polyprotein from transposon TNT 1-94 [Tanacetum coccineum]